MGSLRNHRVNNIPVTEFLNQLNEIVCIKFSAQFWCELILINSNYYTISNLKVVVFKVCLIHCQVIFKKL